MGKLSLSASGAWSSIATATDRGCRGDRKESEPGCWFGDFSPECARGRQAEAGGRLSEVCPPIVEALLTVDAGFAPDHIVRGVDGSVRVEVARERDQIEHHVVSGAAEIGDGHSPIVARERN